MANQSHIDLTIMTFAACLPLPGPGRDRDRLVRPSVGTLPRRHRDAMVLILLLADGRDPRSGAAAGAHRHAQGRPAPRAGCCASGCRV